MKGILSIALSLLLLVNIIPTNNIVRAQEVNTVANVVTYNTNQLKNATSQTTTSQTTTVKATAIGNSRIKLEWTRFFIDWISASETSSYFYITVIDKPQLAGNDQPNQMVFTKDAVTKITTDLLDNASENNSRPLHVIFMTDGEYNGGNSGQAQYLVLNGMAAPEAIINEANRNTDSDYFTSTNTILNYKVATVPNSIKAVIPKLTTRTGSIVVNYVLGDNVDDTNTVSNLSIRSEAHSVTPVAPKGYKLDSEAPELRTLTYENNHQTIDFAVTKLSELHVNYLGMQDMDNTKVVVDPKIYYEGEKAILLGANTITHTIVGVNYYLAGWTTDKSLLTNDRVLVQTKTELNNLTLENFGKEVPVTSDLSYYAVWAPENINSTFNVAFINEGSAYQPTGFDFNHDYFYGEDLLKPVDPSKEQTVSSTFEFIGWTLGEKDIDGKDIIVNLDTLKVTNGLELTAVYKAIPRNYQVKFLNSDGTLISDGSQAYDSTIFNENIPKIPENQTRVGYEYTFAGWETQGTELIVDVANSENPVLVKGNTIYQATYTETARKDLSFRIQFVDGNNAVLAPEFIQKNVTFNETYAITSAMLPTGLTGYVARTGNPTSIQIKDIEINIIKLVYDAVVIPTPAPTPPAPTPEVTTEEIVTPETPQANEPSVDIKDEETPKAESILSWAFINLLMMILTAFASIVLLMIQVIGRKKGMNKTALIRLFSILPAVVSVIAFFVTENMMNPMMMFDKWTLMMVLIAAVQVVVIAFSLKKFDDIEENFER